MRNPALEREILAGDHDPGAYAVYADWLLAAGDPRGELIQRALANRDFDAVFAEHRVELLGRFSLPDSLSEEERSRFPELGLEWRHGFVKRAVISWESPYHDDDPADTCAMQLEQLLRLDVFALIEELELGPILADDGVMQLSTLAGAIEAVAPASLRSLHLGHRGNWDMSSTWVRLPASAAIRSLRHLTLHGGFPALPDLDLPELRTCAIETGQLKAEGAAKLCAAHWPKLESLAIWFGDPEYGSTASLEDIAPLLSRTDLPQLRHLGLMNCAFIDALVIELAGSPLLRQLATLDLSMGNLSDDGVHSIVKRRDQFRHLTSINLDNNALEHPGELLPNMVLGRAQTPERRVPRTQDMRGYRYVSVGE